MNKVPYHRGGAVDSKPTGLISVDYVAEYGRIFWINRRELPPYSPHSIIVCYVNTMQIGVYPVPENFISAKHSLIKFFDAFTDSYTLSVWALSRTNDDRYRWKAKLELEGMRVYENPILYINEDLVCLEDEDQFVTIDLDELVLSRLPHSMDYKSFTLLRENWGQVVEIKSIHELCFSLFPN
ncbi:hypothetical protein PIB30_024919 [Stylosanthes scabra]|uniref:Uncharacterized protein n=1 Tax=Stylosanthes scabra TaxID=79078 RepID=A0ABU6T9L5_9FABA|nr:hypothetical protein [Stylosanthes scabra]